ATPLAVQHGDATLYLHARFDWPVWTSLAEAVAAQVPPTARPSEPLFAPAAEARPALNEAVARRPAPVQDAATAQVLDCLQIPAFLCRQTDLLVAAAQTGKCVNIKKGQFLAPEKMRNAVEKVRQAGNPNVLLTDRGTMFGYERLINDMTALSVMRQFAPVIFDATHSVQYPGGAHNVTAGKREFIPLLTRAAVAAGIDGLFLEVHDNPAAARSDAATVWPLDQLDTLLASCARIHDSIRN
ncbi:MAG: 3-deoxy-8-phosphooctulonate synthase, partial [Phycisphaerales bacterium]|nr:3-deoxy-8-phosphooctulonate synthase [Phycisphaerales bacterium]